MKKLVFCALAALSLAGPLATTAASADPPRDHGDRGPGPNRGPGGPGGGGPGGAPGRAGPDRDWRHDRSEWRDDRADRRWDAQRHDGYWYNQRWNYGPPPAAYYGRPGFSLGYRPWARGTVLPRYYFDKRYYIDYRANRLRRPPRGYHWVRDERGDFLLAAVATGIIADIIVNSR
jgi:Ni/Co efflux regulator RcnB